MKKFLGILLAVLHSDVTAVVMGVCMACMYLRLAMKFWEIVLR